MKKIVLFGLSEIEQIMQHASLKNFNFSFYVFDTEERNIEAGKKSNITFITGDVRVSKQVFDALKESKCALIGELEKNYEVLGVKNIIEACQFHGIERIIYLSTILSDVPEQNLPFINRKKICEKLIRSSGIPFAIIKGCFTSSFLKNFILHGKAYYNNSKIYFTDAKQLAEKITNILLSSLETGNEFLIINSDSIYLKDALSNFIEEQERHNVRLKKYGYYDTIKMKLTNSGKDVKEAFELLNFFRDTFAVDGNEKVIASTRDGISVNVNG